MNYRHAFHAGNHADVLKHVVLLAMVEAFKRKATPFFALDTHAGRGRYLLQGEHSDKTGEARAGIFRLLVLGNLPGAVQRYLKRVQADNPVGALVSYPGSPMLVAQSMREQPRRAGVGLRAVGGATGGDGVEVVDDVGVARAGQAGDAALGFARAQRRVGIELVQAAAGVRVQREAGRGLGAQGLAQREQRDVLEHVGVVAGMEGVAVVHGRAA